MSTSESSETPISLEDLYEEIDSNLLSSADIVSGQKFLPSDKLEILLTRSKIEALLKELNVALTVGAPSPVGSEKRTVDLPDFVLKRARKIFFTLVRVGNLSVLPGIVQAELDDGILPIGLHPGKDKEKRVSSYNRDTWTLNNTVIPAISGWTRRLINNFIDHQWLFQATTFPEFAYRKLASKCPVPLLSLDPQDTTTPSAGGFGTVYQLKLYDNSCRGQGPIQTSAEPRIVAVKFFNENLAAYFHKERETLNVINNSIELHPHLLRSIAAFERGKDRCVLFPWAEGGNLIEVWKRNDSILGNEESRASLVSWSLHQMTGIADALHVLHAKNCRHGDLKPENILHFKDGGTKGRLAVADFGLAKFHILDTYRRDGASSNWDTTLKYEPPEVHTHREKPRSRHYDMWSLGCIFLEFAIWITHGWDYLKEFKKPAGLEKFWGLENDKPVIHQRVREEMSKILNHYKANSATKDIVRLVRDRLLVVKFSEAETFAEEQRDSHVRATSAELCDRMKEIQERANENNAAYLSGQRIAPPTGMGNTLAVRGTDRPRRDSGIRLHSDEEERPEGPKILLRAPTGDFGETFETRKPPTHPQTYRVEQTVDLNNRWVSSIDNSFAKALFRPTDWPPSTTTNTARCSECKAIDFLSPQSDIPFNQKQLRGKSGGCSICAVILEALSKLGWTEQRGIITRDGAEFRIVSKDGTKEEPLVLSMYADPRTATQEIEGLLQLGYPNLPEMRSAQQYEIMRAWRDRCDEQHKECYPWKRPEDLPPMPTRVIDVGTASNPALRLVETSANQLKAKYVALSHCWGQLTDDEKFCATKGKMESIKAHIPFSSLPRSFRDAVTVTRELGIQYLWIDSICIIQDDDDDWAAEAQKMGDVFSSAYCTLAASSARSSTEGFLGPDGSEPREPRVTRRVATVTTPDGSHLYLCRNLDNFYDDVEGSVLASRGWVFQERALSRRTIHFTSTQLYWECGKGVHCETLGKLHNAKAALMGDPQFPDSALQYFDGGRIILFEHVYQMYSQLAFTHWSDRAVALLGLESRLGAAFKTRAEFGVLQEYLRRSLLWKRAQTCQRLAHIEQKPGVHVPSWSWMAYEGAIEYLPIAMGNTDWCEENLKNPFEENKSLRQNDDGRAMQIRAIACGTGVIDSVKWNVGVTMDEGGSDSHSDKTLKCIVVGRKRGVGDTSDQKDARLGADSASGDKLSYVLIVKPVPGDTANQYRRVGVGSLLSSQVRRETKFDIVLV
ncbi:HET-domain-containing protein [Apiospora aurea]|uniref:HET-domain-containing protein n=1 Tax=Apiospora aurea TaxID=335848 RepID=A0ABR1Q9Y5_9PEZI